MINILIVDDREAKFKTIRRALFYEKYTENNEPFFPANEYACFPPEDYAKTFCEVVASKAEKINTEEKSTIYIKELFRFLFEYIENNNISCIFLDRSFYDKNELSPGKESTGDIMGKMIQKSNLLRNIPIVMCSRREEDDQAEQTDYENYVYLGTKRSSKAYLWAIKDTLENNAGSPRAFYRKVQRFRENQEYQVDLMIICALDKEYKYIKRLFADNNMETDYHDGYGYDVGYIQRKDGKVLKVLMHNMKGDKFEGRTKGIDEAKLRSRILVSKFKPRYLLMSGVAAGFKRNNAKLGDILIATESYQWDFGKVYKEHDESRSSSHDIDSETDKILKNKFDNESSAMINNLYSSYIENEDPTFKEVCIKEYDGQNNDFSFMQGLVTSGNRVIANDDEISRILDMKKNAIGLEMEVDAIYTVAKENGIKRLALKAVVDYGGNDKDKSWQDFGSYTSAHVLYKLFTEYIDMETN